MRQVMMNADLVWSRLPLFHKCLSVLLALLVFLILFLGGNDSHKSLTLPKLVSSDIDVNDFEYKADSKDPADYAYRISKGDALSSIFQLLRIPQSTMYAILETDLALLALDTLKPGNTLRFWLNPQTQKLDKLEIEFSLAHKVVYQQVEAGGFEYQELIIPGSWKQEVLAGDVKGSFYNSASRAGLKAGEIMEISSLLKEKINFNRGFRLGDTFQIIRSKQTVEGQETGKTRIEAIRIVNRKHAVTAYLYKDSYYDEKGIGLERAFSRYPLAKKLRITSGFNPRRRHPVTRLIRPHNGTDFAAGIGTPVLSTGDGVVTEVRKHTYAGLYIKIKHGQKYKTRYLHLKKAYVRKGQRVSRGQKIALSGNSGRSTGAHLHYELHINNRAVNAMSADIPIMTEIESRHRTAFKKMVATHKKTMG
jgi:murein DD-endopeptidase MepM/ murein hydrolase activator NlpD